jgi:hypothetical protein
MSTSLRAGFIALALLAAAPAFATDCSVHRALNVAACSAPNYLVHFGTPIDPTDPGECPIDGTGESNSACLTAGTPPAPVTITCTVTPGYAYCSATPRGDSLTYVWGGDLSPDTAVNDGDSHAYTDPALPDTVLVCPGSLRYKPVVMVDVIGPNGETATASTTVRCPTTGRH